MQLNFSGKQDVYIEIAEKYMEYIKLGLIKNGEKLPSVRDAAVELGVNPNTIARAYGLLEEKGYVRALPKKGAFVIYGEDDVEESSAIDARPILLELKNKGIRYEDLISQAKEVFDKND